MDLGEQVWKGSFGGCFSGNYGGALQGDAEATEAPRSGKPRDNRGDTEWALKMALTYAGQDPLQVWTRTPAVFRVGMYFVNFVFISSMFGFSLRTSFSSRRC